MMLRRQNGWVDQTIFVMILGFLALVVFYLPERICLDKWSRSGLKAEYSITGTCQVQMRDGRWLPTSALRDTDLAPAGALK